MEYYLISLFVSIIAFMIIQYIDYNKSLNNPEEEPYSLFKLSNLLLFVIIYLVFTIAFFYLKASNVKLFSFLEAEKGGNKNNDYIKDDIDPKVLSKINDNFETGFAPFNSDDDGLSLSSMSSNSSSQ